MSLYHKHSLLTLSLFLCYTITASAQVPRSDQITGSAQIAGSAQITGSTAIADSSPFSGGSGAPDDPYLIANSNDLNLIRDYPDAHFRQTADIDLDMAPWNAENGWIPIGTFIEENDTADSQKSVLFTGSDDSPVNVSFNRSFETPENASLTGSNDSPEKAPFTGSYDGDGFVIFSLFIDRPDSAYAGLFGYAVGAEFLNITIEDADITALGRAGILAGDIWESTVTNSHSSGSVNATSDTYAHAGGLVGINNENSTMVDCSSSADVSAPAVNNRYTGGLAGLNRGGDIISSFAEGNVTGFYNVGGLAGSNMAAQVQQGPFATITGSHATGIVTGQYYHAGGLVGSNWNATISDSYATGPVNGNHDVGGLAGHNTNGVITTSHATGEVFARGNYAGGLVGGSRQPDSEITRSYATGNVHADFANAGGLVGYNYQGSTIRECFATGNVDGGRAGGLVGVNGNRNDHQASHILDSYATGSVTSNNYAGGLVGENTPSDGQTSIFRSYAIGHVTPYATEPGGLVGTVQLFDSPNPDDLVDDSFFNSETTGFAFSAGGEQKTTSEMLQADTFVGWNMDDTWTIMDGESYPYLSWQEEPAGTNRPQPQQLLAVVDDGAITLSWDPPFAKSPEYYVIYRDGDWLADTDDPTFTDQDVETYVPVAYQVAAVYPEGSSALSNKVDLALHSGFSGGSGTPDDPFLVADAEQLFNVRFHRSSHFLQTRDISLAGYDVPITDENSAGWSPIGDYDVDLLFAGTYNGDEHQIAHLTVQRTDADYTGLFGYVRRATLQNIILQNVEVLGSDDTGGLAGKLDLESRVMNCHVRGSVTGTNGAWNIGGLIGSGQHSTIERSSTGGMVQGDGRSTGGLLGYQTHSVLSDSYSNADVAGDVATGGLTGWNGDGGVVRNSYSTGSVQGKSLVGGLIGHHQQLNVLIRAVTENSYWDTEQSGNAESDAGEGRTTEEMTWPYAENTFTDWDFDEIWTADTDLSNNEGYPYLIELPMVDTGVRDGLAVEQPETVTLSQNYPNPFNPVTTIRFSVPEEMHVRLTVHNLIGQQVATLLNENRSTGRHEIPFDASPYASGVFLYRLEADGQVITRQMMLIK